MANWVHFSLRKKPPLFRSSEVTPKSVYLGRREFLRAAGITTAAAVTGVLGSAREAAAEKLTITSKTVTTGNDKVASLKDISSYNNFYEFGPDKTDPEHYAGRFHPRP